MEKTPVYLNARYQCLPFTNSRSQMFFSVGVLKIS